jgi:hypothetical protein
MYLSGHVRDLGATPMTRVSIALTQLQLCQGLRKVHNYGIVEYSLMWVDVDIKVVDRSKTYLLVSRYN